MMIPKDDNIMVAYCHCRCSENNVLDRGTQSEYYGPYYCHVIYPSFFLPLQWCFLVQVPYCHPNQINQRAAREMHLQSAYICFGPTNRILCVQFESQRYLTSKPSFFCTSHVYIVISRVTLTSNLLSTPATMTVQLNKSRFVSETEISGYYCDVADKQNETNCYKMVETGKGQFTVLPTKWNGNQRPFGPNDLKLTSWANSLDGKETKNQKSYVNGLWEGL